MPPSVRCAIIAQAGALLAGCASLPSEDAARPATTVVPDAFEVAARFSARRGEEAVAGRFEWSHRASGDTIVFSAPTGQALARLVGDAGHVRLEMSDGRTETAPGWEELTQKALGVPVPVRGLAYWIRGLPRPGSEHRQETDAEGRVAVLRQDGWEIVYGYRDSSAPARLRLTYPDVDVRLAVEDWR